MSSLKASYVRVLCCLCHTNKIRDICLIRNRTDSAPCSWQDTWCADTLRHVRLTALALTSHSGKEKTGWGKERSVGTGYLFLWGGCLFASICEWNCQPWLDVFMPYVSSCLLSYLLSGTWEKWGHAWQILIFLSEVSFTLKRRDRGRRINMTVVLFAFKEAG